MSIKYTILSTAILMTFCGCIYKAGPEASTTATQLEILVEELDDLYVRYLYADVEEARRCLDVSAGLLHDSSDINSKERAHGLWLVYARMRSLESHVGNVDKADIATVKEKYWYLRKLEVLGRNIEDIVVKMKNYEDEFIASDFILQYDQGFTDGKGASYRVQTMK